MEELKSLLEDCQHTTNAWRTCIALINSWHEMIPLCQCKSACCGRILCPIKGRIDIHSEKLTLTLRTAIPTSESRFESTRLSADLRAIASIDQFSERHPYSSTFINFFLLMARLLHDRLAL